jgi:hypothetical protein
MAEGAQSAASNAEQQTAKKLPFGHPDAKGLKNPVNFMLVAGPTGLLCMNLRMMFLGLQNGERISDDKRVNKILDEQYGSQDTPERRAAFKRMNSTIVSKHTMGPVVEQRAAMFNSPGEFCNVASQGATAQMGHRGGEKHVNGVETEWGVDHKCIKSKKSLSRQTSFNPNARFSQKKSSVKKGSSYSRTKSNLEGVISAEM